ncbi:MAG: hypothetical protein ABIX28_11355 [Vicinamibacterales bacterium]
MTRSLLALCILLSTVLASACRDTRVVTNSYASLSEARAAGAFSAGYLPEGLPPSAHDIREAHDPDSADRWVIFSFPASERDRLEALLDPAEQSVGGQRADVPGRVEWWPTLLRDVLDAERIKSTGLQIYRSRSSDRLYAVNWSQGRAYVWTAHIP